MNLYITADRIGTETGGGSVTRHESEALRGVAEENGKPCQTMDRTTFDHNYNLSKLQDPWGWDDIGWELVYRLRPDLPRLTHFYAGTFTETVKLLKENSCKVTYTAAAHDVQKSKEVHLELGIPYDYPHLTDPELWKRYLGGYLLADVLVCPSQHSADVMRSYGRTGAIEVIPHGVTLPATTTETPREFVVGYLGAYGPDKGVRFLLEAWKKLNYKDATLLLGGRDSTSPFVDYLIKTFGGGKIVQLGWLEDVSVFYNSISVYCQPSITEGFGCEVSEAMAHGRPVICSTGAGACDLVPEGWTYDPGDVEELALKIDLSRSVVQITSQEFYQQWRNRAEKYTWDKVKEMYKNMWRGLLNVE